MPSASASGNPAASRARLAHGARTAAVTSGGTIPHSIRYPLLSLLQSTCIGGGQKSPRLCGAFRLQPDAIRSRRKEAAEQGGFGTSSL